MKVEVDRDLCEANSMCVQYAPEVFELDDDDVLHISNDAITERNTYEVEAGMAACPRAALSEKR